MRTVGAAQFIINSGNPVSESAFNSVRRWLRQSLVDQLPVKGPPVDLPINGELRLPAGGELEISSVGEDTGIALWTCNWSHPDTSAPRITRRERIQLAQTTPGPAQLEILEMASSADSSEERLALPAGGMSFVAPLLQTFQCSIEGRPVSAVPRLVTDETLVDFVRDDLSSSRRRLPLVLISKDSGDSTALVDPTRLASITAGLAEVYLMQDSSVGLGLSDLVPRRLGCVNGSVRIYNAGFSTSSEPLHHPVTLGDTIKSWRRTAFDPELYFLEKLARSSAISYSEGTTIQQARRALRERLGRQLEQQRTTKASLEEQVSTLRNALEERNRYVRDLEEELERQRKLWYEYRPAGVRSEVSVPSPGGDTLPEFDSVLEALQHAASRWPSDFQVLQSAWDSARGTDSRRHTEVFTALAAVRDVATQTFLGTGFGQNLEAVYRQRYNLRYRSEDHQATVDEYGDYRRFNYNGERMLFSNHITIGANSSSCVQIYFHLDDRAHKVVVGYCGKHLPTKGWQS